MAVAAKYGEMSDRKLWSRVDSMVHSILDSVDQVDNKHLVRIKVENLDRVLKELHSRDKSTQLYLWAPQDVHDAQMTFPTAYIEA